MEPAELIALQTRLQKLERRLRIGAIAWILSLAAIVLLSLVVERATSQPTLLRGQSLELRDAAGKVRLKMTADDGPPLHDAQVWLSDASGTGHLILNVSSGGLTNETIYGSGFISVTDVPQSSADITLRLLRGEAKLEITDREGYSATLGQTDLKAAQTGTVTKRSAASLVLFNKSGNVIWSAP